MHLPYSGTADGPCTIKMQSKDSIQNAGNLHVVLIQPPIEDFYDTDIRLEPLGLLYLEAALRKRAESSTASEKLKGLKITIRDYHSGRGRRTIQIPSFLRHTRDLFDVHDKSHFSSFFNYYRFGETDDEILKDLKNLQPDIIGISFLFSAYHMEALSLAEKIRSLFPDTVIAAGGSHASAAPESLLQNHKVIDYVFTGEAEESFADFVSAFAESGRNFPHNNRIIRGRILPPDDIPFPARNATDMTYRYNGRKMAFLMTSRGCPWKCSFCSVHSVFGHRYRRRSNDSVLREIRMLYESGTEVFDFEDDNLTFRKEEAAELFSKIADEYPEKKLRLYAMNGISYRDLDRNLINILYNAGFRQLNLSLVSLKNSSRFGAGSPGKEKTSDLLTEDFSDLAEYAASIGLPVVSYQILGLPGETVNDIMDTFEFQSGLPVSLGASPYYSVPGENLPESLFRDSGHMAAAGRITTMTMNLSLTSEMPAQLTGHQIHSFFILSRIINFLKKYPEPFRLSEYERILRIMERNTETTAKPNGKQDSRTLRSIYILRKLFREGVLLADTGREFRERKGTDPGIFRQFSERDPLIRPIPEIRE